MSQQHIHYVGQGIKDKMQELDDSPATCEKYPFAGDQAGEVSLAWGVSGMLYVYVASIDRVIVNATLDQVLAGGVV